MGKRKVATDDESEENERETEPPETQTLVKVKREPRTRSTPPPEAEEEEEEEGKGKEKGGETAVKGPAAPEGEGPVPMDEDVPVKKEKTEHRERGEGNPEEEEDPVVFELDVCLANRLFEHLHLFQFPLRPPNRPYNLEHVTQMKMQLASKRVELELDPKTDHGSLEGLDEDDEGEAKKHQRYVLSSRRTRNKTNYAVGVLRGGALHMTGLANIHQLRPDLERNQQSNPTRKVVTKQEDENPEDRLSAAEKARLQMTLRQMEGRMRSLWLDQQNQDSWIEMGLSSAANPESKKGILERLFAPQEVVQMNPKHTTALYLSQLFKKSKDGYTKEQNAKVPLAMAGEFDWKRQVHSLVVSARVIRFDTIRKHLRAQQGKQLPSDAELLAHLQDCCVVIRGLFIVKAVPQFEPDGTAALVREWVLWNLWKAEHLRREVLAAPPFALPMFPTDVKKILQDVAVMVANEDPVKRLWQLKQGNRDESFLSNLDHKKFLEQQEAQWEGWEKTILRNVAPAGQRVPRQVFPWVQATQRRSADTMQLRIQAWMLKQFENKGVILSSVLNGTFKEACRKSTQTPRPGLFERILADFTVPFNDALVLRSLPRVGNVPNELNKYRPLFIKLFSEKPAWESRDLLAKVAEIPQECVKKILKELATQNGTLYTAKSGM